MSITFLITTLVVVATPGTGVIFTLSAALSHGRRAGLVAAFGCTLAAVPHAALALTGLAALLQTGGLAFLLVKYLGVAYLLGLAWAMLRDRGGLAAPRNTPPRTATRVIVSAVLVNLLNPKPALFFIAFLPQFVPADASGATPRMLVLSGVFVLCTWLVFSGYGLFAAAVRGHLLTRPRVTYRLRQVFAASFLALGVKLALTTA
ncbi:LysE family translocator [Micromonospora mirobrigensis]|uniref:Threonine/homoserine/homoserine lactone efflux protein n=1 Tax=Micromonospora mirobrigensis TaxID=262898 RepID=A0A1C4W5I6_9ACTN|nr:LysE family translocator [Micromonospora mirobrigensis]SCE91435.1 Threonine/homoserine/homoserine lactone efflux protein [Micromonospora mirobrigensis]